MLQFVREISISIKIQKTLSHRRGFHFYVAAGFSSDVGPLSGMSVNLVLVDQWLKELKSLQESQIFETEAESLNDVFSQIHAQSAQFLKAQASKAQDPTLSGENRGPVQLASLSFKEERGFGFASFLIPVDTHKDLEFFSSHYLEVLPPGGEARLLKIQTYWQHKHRSQDDYGHESFKLLKPLMVMDADALVSQLTSMKGHRLQSGSHLSRIEIQDIGRRRSIEI